VTWITTAVNSAVHHGSGAGVRIGAGTADALLDVHRKGRFTSTRRRGVVDDSIGRRDR
jgi:hypothetical protein